MLTLALAALALAGASAQASCSRPLQVPVAPIGLSVIVADSQISGVYPDVMRMLGQSCRFQFDPVPRARVEALFFGGRADLLIPASRSPRRDEAGVFVPLIQARPTLVSLQGQRAPVKSLAELLQRRELRVVLVRGFDYGSAYQQLSEALRAQGRLSLDSDVVSVARMLELGLADVTVMAPSVFIGALHSDARVRHLVERVRSEPVDELPWADSGAYVSRTALSEPDRQALVAWLERPAVSAAIWEAFQRYYPAGSLEGSIKPR